MTTEPDGSTVVSELVRPVSEQATIEVHNHKIGERLTFDTPASLVAHLTERMKTRGHYVLSYDDVIVRTPKYEWCFRGDYVLLHALAGVPLPHGPFKS